MLEKKQQRLTIPYQDDFWPYLGEIAKLPRHCSVQSYQNSTATAYKRDEDGL